MFVHRCDVVYHFFLFFEEIPTFFVSKSKIKKTWCKSGLKEMPLSILLFKVFINSGHLFQPTSRGDGGGELVIVVVEDCKV